jgi:hypothetical protein
MRRTDVIRSLGKKYYLLLFLLLGAVFLLGSAMPGSTYKTPLGGSKWRVGTKGIIATIDLNEPLFSDMGGLKHRYSNYASASDAQLQRIATEFIQPYLDKKLSVSVNGKQYPVKVTRVTRNDIAIYSIWLSIENIHFDRPQNAVRIEYNMLFDEVKNEHLNLAYLYRSNASGDALQRLFDSVPAKGQFEFSAIARIWEFTVTGATSAPQPLPSGTRTQEMSQSRGRFTQD